MCNNNPKKWRCAFCNKVFDVDSKDSFVIQSPVQRGLYICFECVKKMRTQFAFAEEKRLNELSASNRNKKIIPSTIKSYLDQYIVGQEQAKKIISVAVYNHYKALKIKEKDPSVELEKSNILLLGPSGCGKTAMLKSAAKFLSVPFAMADANNFTSAGYVGKDVESVLQTLINNAGGDVKKAEKGIVFLDEIDKLSRKGANVSTSADPGHEGVQQALLKMIEGAVVDVPLKGKMQPGDNNSVKLDTSRILFIAGGAFEGIEDIISERIGSNSEKSIGFSFNSNIEDEKELKYNDYIDSVSVEDLKQFGIIPELLGRLPIISTMHQLDKNALIQILTEPKNALVRQYKRIFKEDNIKLSFTKKALEEIADRALETKTGARSLRSVLEDALKEPMFDLPDTNATEVIVSANPDTKEIMIKSNATDEDNRIEEEEDFAYGNND